ncbi:MAG: hypothetical protein LLG97_03955 [Deltaproteobacteria bacterium]|nr:hypothetical protein [Deltaproteobacteria bacterium]
MAKRRKGLLHLSKAATTFAERSGMGMSLGDGGLRQSDRGRLTDPEYVRAIDLSRRIAVEVGTPRFYLEREREVALSRELCVSDPLLDEARRIVEERGDRIGHGLTHVRKVAIDAGALILIEKAGELPGDRVRRLVLLAHLAGLFHDIRRSEKNHAERGADEAAGLLAAFPLQDDERREIADAIRNHEAFRPSRSHPGLAEHLLSDALYDADKFRWGPDNFTETLWAMIIPRGIPLRALLPRFLSGMEGIRKIRGSFRTATGRDYGPDFIDRGLAIGQQLYKELTAQKNIPQGISPGGN